MTVSRSSAAICHRPGTSVLGLTSARHVVTLPSLWRSVKISRSSRCWPFSRSPRSRSLTVARIAGGDVRVVTNSFSADSSTSSAANARSPRALPAAMASSIRLTSRSIGSGAVWPARAPADHRQHKASSTRPRTRMGIDQF